MELGLLSFSFAAGAAAFFNPCGFALLPSYVAYYVGNAQTASQQNHGWGGQTLYGLRLGLVVSAGFVTAFGIIGVVLVFVGGVIARYFSWVAALVGLGLIVVGILMLMGRSISLSIPTQKVFGILPQSGSRRSELRFYYLYGISYAVASLSCTIPIFMIVVVNAFGRGVLNGLAQYGAYAAGMAAMMIGLSLAMAWSKESIQRYLSSMQRYVHLASALVLIGAGAYLIYYNLFYSGLLGF